MNVTITNLCANGLCHNEAAVTYAHPQVPTYRVALCELHHSELRTRATAEGLSLERLDIRPVPAAEKP